MNEYEAIFILRPDLTDAKKQTLVSAIADMIKKHQGEIKIQNEWGKKELSYKIKKFKEGIFHQIDFSIKPESISELKKQYGLNEDILRVSIIRK